MYYCCPFCVVVCSCVLERGVFTLGTSTIVANEYNSRPTSPSASQHLHYEGSLEAITPRRTIEVHGLAANEEEGLITMFFQNKKRSGGGHIEDFEFNPVLGVAYITFANPEGRYIVYAKEREQGTFTLKN